MAVGLLLHPLRCSRSILLGFAAFAVGDHERPVVAAAEVIEQVSEKLDQLSFVGQVVQIVGRVADLLVALTVVHLAAQLAVVPVVSLVRRLLGPIHQAFAPTDERLLAAVDLAVIADLAAIVVDPCCDC